MGNPAFAIYPGKLWAPDVTINLRRGCEGDEVCKFHQETDCVNRFLGGKGKWQNCTSTLVTGKNNLNDVQRVAEWRGNTSLVTGNEFVHPIETMAGTLSHQMRPYGWEGFQEYNLTYLTRARGLSFQGADVMYILNADHLMLIELVRCPTGNLEIGMADLSEEFYAEWPIRKKLDAENYTRRFWARANRYETTAKTFLDGRERAGYRLKDVHGERYRCPYGMISLEAIADSPCFISLPHFWGNEIWGGLEARRSISIQMTIVGSIVSTLTLSPSLARLFVKPVVFNSTFA